MSRIPHTNLKTNRSVSAAEIAAALGGKPSGSGWIAYCPSHDDHTPSLKIDETPEGKVLFHCHASCTQEEVLAALREQNVRPERKLIARYRYRDEHGVVLFEVLRYRPKDFRVRQPKGKSWTWNLKGVRRVPYCLPEVLQAETVYIVEGEKDVLRLRKMGEAATCNPGGAGKWCDAYSAFLKDKGVVIIPDNDPPGLKHAEAVARSVDTAGARWIKIVHLPAGFKDASDWIASGGTKPQLVELVKKTPKYQPPADAPAGCLMTMKASDVTLAPIR